MSRRGFIPPGFIDDLIARVDIVEVINTRVPLKRAGNSYKACCPFHQEKTPSFIVNQHKQLYHCFGCGAKGSVITFMMTYEHLDFLEVIEYLAHYAGMVIPYEEKSKPDPRAISRVKSLLDWLMMADQYFQNQLRTHVDKKSAVDYLKQRGLSAQDVKQFNIGFAPDGWHGLLDTLRSQGATVDMLVEAGLVTSSGNRHYDRFRGRIMFPIRNRKGETIGFGARILDKGEPKYLNSPESPVFIKGQELYGLYELRKNVRNYSEIIVVEGYMDVVMLAHYGIANVVATLGTATSTAQIELLMRYTHRIIFCFDGDEAGHAAAFKAMQSSLPALQSGKEIHFLFLPDKEDPDSFVRQHGQKTFLERVSQAIPLSSYLFDYFQKKYDISSVEGRSMILEEIGALINQMPDTSLRDLLREELRQRTEVQEAIFKRYVKAGVQRKNPVFFQENSNKTLVERALIILLNDLSLAQELEGIAFLLESNQKGAQILYKVITLLQDYPAMKHTAQLLNHLIDEPWYSWVAQLSYCDTTLQDNFHMDELKDLLNQLAKRDDPLKQVLLKLKQGIALSEEEARLLK